MHVLLGDNPNLDKLLGLGEYWCIACSFMCESMFYKESFVTDFCQLLIH